MKFVSRIAIAAACAAFVLSPAASASGRNDCVHLGKQVSEALSAAQPGQATDQARAQADAGRSYCSTGLFAQGVASYTKALHLLGKA
ncbi:MAG TPA: hypothetical protein VMU01_02700 [Rhizomicrobium sp.]|nr:hypothetical protein [Rhizomicrobium sp.]